MIKTYLDSINKLDALDKLLLFKEILIKWDRVHNLTGDIALIDENILDSLRPYEFLKPFHSCVDIGSGAGFPAIPLAIFYQNLEFTLIEPRKKRAAFLKYLSLEMKLNNVIIIDDFSYNVQLKNRANLLTSRAVGAVSSILKDSHLIEENGYFLLFKGNNYKEEISKLALNDLNVISFNKRNYLYFRKEV